MALLMHQLRRTNLDRALREAWNQGVVLTGTSAGASCWFTQALSASAFSFLAAEEEIVVRDGLGLLPHSLSVHHDLSSRRRKAFRRSLEGGLVPGFGVDHDAGLHFHGAELHRVVARRRGAGAWMATAGADGTELRRLEGRSLGLPGVAAALDLALQTLWHPVRRRLPAGILGGRA